MEYSDSMMDTLVIDPMLKYSVRKPEVGALELRSRAYMGEKKRPRDEMDKSAF